MNFSVNVRYLGYLKSYVRNKQLPEGSTAKCYITEECLIYCSQYMEGNAESKNNHDVEKESPDFSFSQFLVNIVPSNLSTGHSCMLKCITRIIIACLTVMKLPLILSMLYYTNF